MSEHRATVEWRRNGAEFKYETYPRNHELRFDAVSVRAAAAPENIPATAAGAAGVDPEQAFVGALSSCHMLWFLHLEVSFSGQKPTQEEHEALHEQAHKKCFIANSVKSAVRIEPRLA
ncbi:MAG TPA: OsmC family protein [Burkholderiales bacterium]|nr:OsmC family protein [Burkholderiales bacterium]